MQDAAIQEKAAPEKKDMDYTFEGQPDFALVKIKLKEGETVKAEASAMVTMDTNIRMETKFKGGFKRFLGGESIFINEFTAEQFPGEIAFASGMPGDMRHTYVEENEPVFLQSGAFIAAGKGVELLTKWQGLVKGFFSGAGMFLIKAEGKGDLFFNSYGGIIEVDVTDEYFVDTNHIVGFTGGLEYSVTKFGGYKSFFFSGEGLVARFKGQGKLWIQTRNYPGFAAWVWPFRPQRSND